MLSVPHSNHIRKTQNLARILLDLQGQLHQNRVMWSGTPDYDSEIDSQGDVDEAFPDAALTLATLADAQYALAAVDEAITAALVPLTVLANLP